MARAGTASHLAPAALATAAAAAKKKAPDAGQGVEGAIPEGTN